MSIPYNLIRVSIDSDALKHNWQMMHGKGGNAMAVVKADAYGHGLLHVARVLDDAGCRRMAVGTVQEAVYLRENGFTGQIVALLGALDDTDCEAVTRHDIIPFCGSEAQLEHLEKVRRTFTPDERLPLALKFDTGMRRLGFNKGQIHKLLQYLEKHPGLQVVMAASHLATADMPEQEDFVLQQGRDFAEICNALAPLAPFDSCLANSAAIMAYPALHLDLQRPGVALYGGNPFYGTAWEEKGHGLKQVMHVEAPVLQVRELAPGESISYGRTWVADKPTRVAIVATGYADAYSRGLSSGKDTQSAMLLHGKRVPIVGRVCMQMTAVNIENAPHTKAGDTVTLLGGRGKEAISPDELASWWGTISYEVMCLLGQNPRK